MTHNESNLSNSVTLCVSSVSSPYLYALTFLVVYLLTLAPSIILFYSESDFEINY